MFGFVIFSPFLFPALFCRPFVLFSSIISPLFSYSLFCQKSSGRLDPFRDGLPILLLQQGLYGLSCGVEFWEIMEHRKKIPAYGKSRLKSAVVD